MLKTHQTHFLQTVEKPLISSMTTKNIDATFYRVSTITCNGSINTSVDLTILYDKINVIHFENPENGFICATDRNGKETKGFNPLKKKTPKKKDSETEGRKFDNAISTYYKIQNDYYPNVKIFKNGTIQMTGLKTIPEGEILHGQVFKTLYKVYQENPEIFEKEPTFHTDNFYVRMINSDFSVPYLIRRKELHLILISEKYQNSCSFQPETYPGVKLQYFWNPLIGNGDGICKCTESKCLGKGNGNGHGQCKKVTISIFESGKILITGATNFEQINEGYGYITKNLTANYNTICKVYN
jgi:TATA-box binding protein (TBP) (component of TFIID and TFIIIB)